jgi:hypothetical protein
MGSKWKGTKNIAFSGGDSVTLSRNPNLPYLSGGFSLLNSKMTESQAENFISIIQKKVHRGTHDAGQLMDQSKSVQCVHYLNLESKSWLWFFINYHLLWLYSMMISKEP